MSSKSTVWGPSPSPMSRSTVLPPRRASFTFPEHLKAGEDADVDVAAPRTRRGQYLNQSFLSVIAMTNVGEPAPLQDSQISAQRVDSPYSDNTSSSHTASLSASRRSGRSSTSELPAGDARSQPASLSRSRHKEPQLEAVAETMSSSSQAITPRHEMTQSMLLPSQPQEIEASSYFSGQVDGSEGMHPATTSPGLDSREGSKQEEQAAVELPQKLAEVFGFDEPEAVEADFPCWLLQSVLLQGHLYVTARHVCFYAYLPRNRGATSKSGFLAKRGRQNPAYRRYWFVLKGHALYYYTDAADLYFPRSTIDLRTAIAAEPEGEQHAAGGRGFRVTTATRTHRFRADSAASAGEWVKQISQAIFRARNDGDSVKVSLPVENMLEIEENPVLDFAETLKIRIIDNDETFAVDDYFFSFFGHGRDALEVLQLKVARNAINRGAPRVRALAEDLSRFSPTQPPTDASSAVLSSPEHSLDISGLRIEPQQPVAASSAPDAEEISGSIDTSQSLDASSVSASQILQRSDIYSQPLKPRHGRDDQPRKTTRLDASGDLSASSRDMDDSATSSTRLQDLMRAGAAPLQKATGLAGALREQSLRVGGMLASESKVYYEKVTNMWAGRTMHFDDGDAATTARTGEDSDDDDDGDGKNGVKHAARFQAHFALPTSERLRASYHGYLNRSIPVYGKFYISDVNLCFRNLLPTAQTRMLLPLADIEIVEKEKGFRFGYAGLVVVVRGHEELFLEFGRADARDDLCGELLQSLGDYRSPERTAAVEREAAAAAAAARVEFEALEQARRSTPKDADAVFETVRIDDDGPGQAPVIFDDMNASVVDFRPTRPQRVTCLTIGSRGDVQPYIALCKGLMADGHTVRIATHAEFEPWIRSHGIGFVPVAGDPAEIMRLCVEHDMFTVSFFREATAKFRGWIDQLLRSAWVACQDSDLLIESPSAMAGIHIAEALEIPYFRAFTMPWTRTRAYPHAFAVPTHKRGGNYNLLSYVMFDNVFWQATAGQINRWRTKTLGLAPTSLDKMKNNSVPFLYNFSPSVVARPVDFSPWIHVTGYWFLDEGEGYEPPDELADFIRRARRDGKKIVYVGFGSIVVDDPGALTQTVVDSVIKADVRCILSKGWSDRLEKRVDTTPEVRLPPEIIQIKSAPHDWLFGQIDAAVHHGGAGTTGASLRAGIPTIVKPFFGDQFFFGSRVEDLGVGRCLLKINTPVFARALWEVTKSERLIAKAKALGEQIRQESGVERAIQVIYRDLDYAKSLIKSGNKQTAKPATGEPAEAESWTLVGEDSDFDEGPE